MSQLIRLAFAAAAVSLSLHGATAQTTPAAPPPQQAPSQQPVFSPLTNRWTFPNVDAVNAGTVTIITAPAGGAKSVFAADMARVIRGEKPSDFSSTHDLDVQETVLRASSMPIDS